MTAIGAVAFGLGITALVLALRAGDVAMTALPLGRIAAWSPQPGVTAAHVLDVLRAIEGALRSGMPLPAALRLATEGQTRIDDPFLRALRVFELNAPLSASLRSLADARFDHRSDLAIRALAIVATEQLPTARAAALVGGIADRIAFETRLAEEVTGRTSGLRAQIVLLALIVPGLAGYLVATVPGLADVLSSSLGVFVLMPAAAIFEIAGIIASRAILRSIE